MVVGQRQLLQSLRDDRVCDLRWVSPMLHPGSQPTIKWNGRVVREGLQARLRLCP